MPYCTLDDLKEKISEEELIQLTDDEETGLIVTSRTDRAIADADAKIDGYCAVRFSVLFEPVPPLVRKLSVDIAIYNLLQRRQGADEDRERDYKDAIQYLQDIAKGKATPGVQPPPDPPGEDDLTGGSQVSARDKMFGTDTMDKY
jgi:phage gp36-like protein